MTILIFHIVLITFYVHLFHFEKIVIKNLKNALASALAVGDHFLLLDSVAILIIMLASSSNDDSMEEKPTSCIVGDRVTSSPSHISKRKVHFAPPTYFQVMESKIKTTNAKNEEKFSKIENKYNTNIQSQFSKTENKPVSNFTCHKLSAQRISDLNTFTTVKTKAQPLFSIFSYNEPNKRTICDAKRYDSDVSIESSDGVSFYTPYTTKDLPFIYINIFKSQVRTLIDTGASISALRFADIPLGFKLEPLTDDIRLNAVNGTPIHIYGKFRTTFHIGPLTFTWTFLVVDCDFSILGYDFLKINNIFIQFGQYGFTLSRFTSKIATSKIKEDKGVQVHAFSIRKYIGNCLVSEYYPNMLNNTETKFLSQDGKENVSKSKNVQTLNSHHTSMHRIGGLVTQPQNNNVRSCSHLDHKMDHNMDHSLDRNLDHRLTHDFSSQMGHQQHPKHDMPQPPTCDPPLLGRPNNGLDNKDASRQLTPSIPQESHVDLPLTGRPDNVSDNNDDQVDLLPDMPNIKVCYSIDKTTEQYKQDGLPTTQISNSSLIPVDQQPDGPPLMPDNVLYIVDHHLQHLSPSQREAYEDVEKQLTEQIVRILTCYVRPHIEKDV